MRAYSLMYHDVVARPATSGFQGGWADYYKIAPQEFADHLDAIGSVSSNGAGGLVTMPWPDKAIFITFDDGGASSLDAAALLEDHGWRGHFFIATDFIGKPGFLSESQLNELARRGHCIGSHGVTHPARMSACSASELDHEWQTSARILGNILGKPVTTASVPGGYYSRDVGAAADRAGLKFLFTSEPTSRLEREGACTILGRYYIRRGTPASAAASFAGGPRWARLRQSSGWTCKKLAKAAGGPLYLRVAARIRER